MRPKWSNKNAMTVREGGGADSERERRSCVGILLAEYVRKLDSASEKRKLQQQDRDNRVGSTSPNQKSSSSTSQTRNVKTVESDPQVLAPEPRCLGFSWKVSRAPRLPVFSC